MPKRNAQNPSTSESKSSAKRARRAAAAAAAPAQPPADGALSPRRQRIQVWKEQNGKTPSLERYLRLILKRLNPDASVTKDALLAVESVLFCYARRLLLCARDHLESAQKKTLQLSDISTCVPRSFGWTRTQELTDFLDEIVKRADRAITVYETEPPEAKDGEVAHKHSQAERAGLLLPPVRIRTFAKPHMSGYRFSPDSIVYMTAVLEFLAEQLLDKSYAVTITNKRKRILPTVVSDCVSADARLSLLVA